MSKKRALITGITGQDGSHLAEFLLGKGYEVHGLIRRASSFNTDRLDHLYEDPHQAATPLRLHYGDLTDGAALQQLVDRVQPDEVYNLAAQSHVRVSFDMPQYTAETVAIGALCLLDVVRTHMDRHGKSVRVYQAGSSEMFGAAAPPQSETTPFHPRSPYAVSKVAAHWYGVNYREAYGMFVANGILFNHEGPRRGETFVTRKITRAAGRIKEGLQSKLYLGNLNARRDWGYAGDYVEAMWLMLQDEAGDDFVVATGESFEVCHFVERAFALLDLDWREHVEHDPRYLRPSEVDHLQGDPRKIAGRLGWAPKTSFEALVRMMVESDHELAKRERVLTDAGHRTTPRGAATE